MLRVLGWVFILAGCQTSTDHPPPLQGCVAGASCMPPVSTRPPGSGTPPPAGAGGQGGQGGGAGAGGAPNGQLSGTVLDLIDDTFRVGVPFLASALVDTPASNGSLVSARWDGVEPFALSGFTSSSLSWVRVRPEGTIAWLPTIHPIDTQQPRLVELGMAEVELVDFIMASVSPPSERFLGRGHVALLFVRKSDPTQGAPGISVVLPDAGFVAYSQSTTWSNLETATDGSGLVFAGNISASAFPGSTKLAMTHGASSLSLDLRVAADSLTLVEVPIE